MVTAEMATLECKHWELRMNLYATIDSDRRSTQKDPLKDRHLRLLKVQRSLVFMVEFTTAPSRMILMMSINSQQGTQTL